MRAAQGERAKQRNSSSRLSYAKISFRVAVILSMSLCPAEHYVHYVHHQMRLRLLVAVSRIRVDKAEVLRAFIVFSLISAQCILFFCFHQLARVLFFRRTVRGSFFFCFSEPTRPVTPMPNDTTHKNKGWSWTRDYRLYRRLSDQRSSSADATRTCTRRAHALADQDCTYSHRSVTRYTLDERMDCV